MRLIQILRGIGPLFACALMAGSSVGGPISAADAVQKITITVPALEADIGPVLVALKKGYFADEGLDVQLQSAGGGIATPALISGSVDASASSASALTAILKGAPLRIVAVFQGRPPYKIWAAENIRTLGDLKGKAVGVQTRGDTLEIATRLALARANIPPDAVSYTPLGVGATAGGALDTGALAAVVVSDAQTLKMQEAGQLKHAHVLIDLSSTVRMPYAGLVMQQKTIAGNPVLTKKILRAIAKGMRYQVTFKNQTVAILDGFQTDPDPRATSLGYDDFMLMVSRDLTVKNDQVIPDLAIRARLLDLAADKVPPVGQIYDFSIVRAIDRELGASRWSPSP